MIFMSVEIISAERIIPLDYEEKRNKNSSTYRICLPPTHMSPSTFTRSLAVLLEYPYGTKIQSGSASDGFPRSMISGRDSFSSPEVSAEFILAKTYVWVHKEMEKNSPERYAKMMEVAPRLDEAILDIKDTRVIAPRFYGEPDCFEDIVAISSMYRPGPLKSGMVSEYASRKADPKTVTYIHESLKEVLELTYGILIYQEQVMEIAHKLGGLPLSDSDRLRKVLTKYRLADVKALQQNPDKRQ